MSCMTLLRVLSVAAAYRRVAYVLLSERKLADWRISEKAALSPENASSLAQSWIKKLRPEIVVTERTATAKKKGDGTKALISAIAKVAAEDSQVFDLSLSRSQPFTSKYEEAQALADLYPEIAPWVPKKHRFYDNEPRNTVLFEALALAHQILNKPPRLLFGPIKPLR